MAARKPRAPKAAHHEIRFLSGGKPVKDLAPIVVWPSELLKRRGGLTLARALQIVRGPTDPVVSVDAVLLSGLGVKAMAALGDDICLAPGATIELGANSLLFVE